MKIFKNFICIKMFIIYTFPQCEIRKLYLVFTRASYQYRDSNRFTYAKKECGT